MGTGGGGTAGRVAVPSPFGSTSRTGLRLIGGSEPALCRRRRPPRAASIRLVQRLDAFGDRVRAFARPWEFACFICVPAIALAFACWEELHAKLALEDFGIFRTAALAVIHGHSPYVAPNPSAYVHFDRFVYPPVAALLFAPLAAVPSGPSRALMFAAGLVAILVALRVLSVRDWRCYSVALISAPAINSVALGALTSFLLLGAALCWRYRDKPAVAGVATAVTALLKLFLWPLGVWLVVTRRWRAAIICAGTCLFLLVGGWAVIDFAGLRSYPTILHVLQQVEIPVSYSLVGLFGLSGGAATILTVVLSLAGVVGICWAARGKGGDRRAFAVAIVVSLVATPLLWLHYLLLLFVPIAFYRPRLSGLWFLPLLLWLTPSSNSHGETWRIVLALAVLGIVAVRTLFVSESPALNRAGVAPRPAAS
jgi:alpha-1,2-mannosyltransferase